MFPLLDNVQVIGIEKDADRVAIASIIDLGSAAKSANACSTRC
ncbi:hypothetical protein [Nostoc sp.]